MKREKLITALWSLLLSFLMSFSAVMCMVTAFNMGIDIATLTLSCFVASVVCTVAYCLPLGLLPIGMGAVILGYLWRNDSLMLSVEAILNRLSRQYNRAYGWEIIRWGYRVSDEMEPTILLSLCILGVLIAMAVSWSVCRRKSILPGALLSVLCAATCFVVTDTVPDTVYLYFLLVAFISLLLTGRVRKQDEKQGNRLSLLIVPVTALAMLLLLAAIPKSTYHGQETAQKLTDLVLKSDPMQILMGKDNSNIVTGIAAGGVDLTAVGKRSESEAQVMTVTADFSGTLYLRSRAMCLYDGISWANEADSSLWKLLQWPEQDMSVLGQVQITTRYAHWMLYTPYYIDASRMRNFAEGMENERKLTEYSYRVIAPSDPLCIEKLYPSPDVKATEWDGGLLTQFIRLTDSVKKWAIPMAKEITGDIESPYHKAQAIAAYVRASAVYDTDVAKMPTGEKDFARWFLEKGDAGYCVHFASAAAVLLQASGIPARYVTGYTAQVTAGQTQAISMKQAHAWVEYWLPGFGWTVLEATPQDLRQEQETWPENQTEPTQNEQEQTQTTVPVDTPSQPNRENSDTLMAALAVFAGVFVIIVALWLQYTLRIRAKGKRRSCGTANEQAVFRWQETVQLATLLKEIPDKELFALAQKAKFSQHTITPEELSRFDDYKNAAIQRLKTRSVWYRFYWRILLAVY